MRKLVIILFLIIPAINLRAQNFTPVNILVPTFQSLKGKPEIGRKTSLILALQIWRTYSTQTRARSAFDNANIIYNSKSRPTTYAEVEALARTRTKKPHLVLWGRASEYGKGIVVESNLLIRTGVDKSSLGTNIWSVTIPTGRKSYTVSVDVPARQYEFAPIVLSPDLIAKLYSSNLWRSSTEIYELKSTGSAVIGDLRKSSVEAISHDGDWSRVTLENIGIGWMYLPNLSENPSEVINFCGGIVRILRKDWPGAVSLFQEVVNTSDAPTAIKVDSYLYMAVAYDKMHDEARSFSMVAEAYKLNPYSKTTTKYLYMSYLARLVQVLPRSGQEEEAKKIIQSTQDLLAKNRVLFADDDRWVMQVEQVLAELPR